MVTRMDGEGEGATSWRLRGEAGTGPVMPRGGFGPGHAAKRIRIWSCREGALDLVMPAKRLRIWSCREADSDLAMPRRGFGSGLPRSGFGSGHAAKRIRIWSCREAPSDLAMPRNGVGPWSCREGALDLVMPRSGVGPWSRREGALDLVMPRRGVGSGHAAKRLRTVAGGSERSELPPDCGRHEGLPRQRQRSPLRHRFRGAMHNRRGARGCSLRSHPRLLSRAASRHTSTVR
jgi:hypothetical protein